MQCLCGASRRSTALAVESALLCTAVTVMASCCAFSWGKHSTSEQLNASPSLWQAFEIESFANSDQRSPSSFVNLTFPLGPAVVCFVMADCMRTLVCCSAASHQAFSVAVSMNSIRQIAIQLPEGLQRLQLHLFANGLVGWSPEANSDESDVQSADQTPQTVSPQANLRHAFDRLHVSASEADSTNDEDDYADVESDAGSDPATDNTHQQSPQGMTDEEQIAAVQAFIVGDDTLNPTLQEAAWMAATQLVSSLADSSEYLEPEVISTLQELCVHLHAVDGGLQLKIGHGIMARSIYIYGDDETSDNDDHDHSYEHDTEDDEDAMHGSISSRSVVTGDVASEEGIACPVCLSSYSSNVRMAALGCHHHVCNSCFRRLPRPRTCPICRAHVSSHVEVIM